MLAAVPSPPSIFDRARAVASAVAQGGRLIGSAVASPFGPPSPTDPRPVVPPGSYGTDQPPPAPERVSLISGYHDVTFRTGGYAQQIGGWSVERMRNAIEMGDSSGYFLEAWTLAVACTRFAPIFAALRQRISPELGLQRRILGGARGPSRIAREEIESQLAPRDGEHPSPTFPANLWGAIGICLAMMGFAILQHVYGPPSGPNGWRPVYTRLWPPWAVYFQRYRKTFVAITREAANCDIIDGDGKWTIIATSDEPFTQGAVRALGPEYLAGGFTEQAQQAYIDAWANPHPIATMPPNIGPETPEGRLFFAAAQEFRKPGGVILLPNGATLTMAEMHATASKVTDQALARVVMYVFFALLGNNGSAGKVGEGGVYPSPHLFDAKEEIVRDDTRAIVRGINQGRVRPWTQINIGEVATYPALDIPLPDPEQDARAKSFGERVAKLEEILAKKYENGQSPTQEQVDELALGLVVPSPTVSPIGKIEEWMVEQKIVAADEARAQGGLPALPDDAGSTKRLAAERLAGKDMAGKPASQGDSTLDAAPPTVPEDALPEPKAPPVIVAPPQHPGMAPPGAKDEPPAEGWEEKT